MQESFGQHAGRVHEHLDAGQEKGGKEKGTQARADRVIGRQAFSASGGFQQKAGKSGEHGDRAQDQDHARVGQADQLPNFDDEPDGQDPFESPGQQHELKGPVDPAAPEKKNEGQAEPQQNEPGLARPGVVGGQDQAGKNQRNVAHPGSLGLKESGTLG